MCVPYDMVPQEAVLRGVLGLGLAQSHYCWPRNTFVPAGRVRDFRCGTCRSVGERDGGRGRGDGGAERAGDSEGDD